MTADRHLGAAWVDKCRPTVLITETTYATTIRHETTPPPTSPYIAPHALMYK